jgi:UDPglucose 6-dehydrogenase
MQLAIIGTGYVGVVTGACFAEMGHCVTFLDIDSEKIALLKKGKIPFFEPQLEEMFKRHLHSGRLFFTLEYEKLIEKADIFFITVPTPSLADGSCDTSAILSVAKELATHLKSPAILVIKSTTKVGTHFEVKACVEDRLKERKENFTIDIVSNPEFLKEGSAVEDCMKPDRIILGTTSPHAQNVMRQLYSAFTLQNDRILFMDPLSAEMTKYAANAMLASRISFMNEMALLCEHLGADIQSVRLGIGSDQRIGYPFLYAGVGYGGSCFPKDIAALKHMAKSVDYTTPFLEAIDSVNQRQKGILSKKILRYFSENMEGKIIAIWGLSFKPNTDDIRQAPSLALIEMLLSAGACLRLYDPAAMKNAKAYLSDLEGSLYWAKDEYDAAKGADAIALMTEWKQFRFANFKQIKEIMRGNAFFDGRNQYKGSEMHSLGFDYFGIGTSPYLQGV